MHSIRGEAPSGVPRELSCWAKGDMIHLWIHPPGSGDDSGWEIRVKPEDLMEVLAKTRKPAGNEDRRD